MKSLEEIGVFLADLTPDPERRSDWASLDPAARAQIVIDRGVDWILKQGDLIASPVAFVSSSEQSTGSEFLFDRSVQTLREAVCATHRLLERNQPAAQVALLALSGAILLATGIHVTGAEATASDTLVRHLPTFAPHIAEVVVIAFAKKYCDDASDNRERS